MLGIPLRRMAAATAASVALVLGACDPTTGPNQETGTILVQVRSTANEPLSDVRVDLDLATETGTTRITALTRIDGSIRFTDAPLGKHLVTITPPSGYTSPDPAHLVREVFVVGGYTVVAQFLLAPQSTVP